MIDQSNGTRRRLLAELIRHLDAFIASLEASQGLLSERDTTRESQHVMAINEKIEMEKRNVTKILDAMNTVLGALGWSYGLPWTIHEAKALRERIRQAVSEA